MSTKKPFIARPFTEEEVLYLKANVSKKTYSEIGRELGRNKGSIRLKAMSLGLTPSHNWRRWTKKEIDKLLSLSEITGRREIAKTLNRTIAAIDAKVDKLREIYPNLRYGSAAVTLEKASASTGYDKGQLLRAKKALNQTWRGGNSKRYYITETQLEALCDYLKTETDDFTQKFLSRVVTLPNGCWEWPSRSLGSQVSLRINGQTTTIEVRRAAWFIVKGVLPKYQKILNTCGNGFCINPDHQKTKTLEREHSLEERFWSIVKIQENGCIVWSRPKLWGLWLYKDDGNIFIPKNKAAWLVIKGELLPVNTHTVPLCKTKSCVNPEHKRLK
jgi:hypothetical protein